MLCFADATNASPSPGPPLRSPGPARFSSSHGQGCSWGASPPLERCAGGAQPNNMHRSPICGHTIPRQLPGGVMMSGLAGHDIYLGMAPKEPRRACLEVAGVLPASLLLSRGDEVLISCRVPSSRADQWVAGQRQCVYLSRRACWRFSPDRQYCIPAHLWVPILLI